MRTDSVRVSDDAQAMAKTLFSQFGEKYYPEKPNIYVKGKQNVQDAHEAIRPSYPERTPDSIKKYLDNDQYKFINLSGKIYVITDDSADVANKTVEITAGDCH